MIRCIYCHYFLLNVFLTANQTEDLGNEDYSNNHAILIYEQNNCESLKPGETQTTCDGTLLGPRVAVRT